MENFNATNKRSEVIAWSATYAVVGTMIVVINALTLSIFVRTKSLRTRKHVMVINLAVADLLFGVLGLPFSVVYLLKPTVVFYYVHQALNAFSKTASLFTHGVIAVERMHATIWPLRHHVINNMIYKIALVVIWVLSAFLTTTMGFYQSGLTEATVFYNLLVPMVITASTLTIVACYVSIWISFQRRKQRNLGSAAKHDKALAVTLLLVAGVFLVCWAIPMFYISISALDMCKNCYHPTVPFFRYARLLTAVQSMINPVIYCFGLPAFKASLKVWLHDLKCSDNFGSRRNPRQRQTSKEFEMASASREKVNE
ncbi:trace amine-associated receptor 13c-like [Oculina patagonica]